MTISTRTHLQQLAALAAGIFVGLMLGATIAPASADAGVALAAAAVPTSIADDAASAWRAGWVAVAVMLMLWFAGQAAIARRGYIIDRLPWLDVGRAWAGLSVVLGALVTVLPLAVAGDLDVDALKAQAGLAIGLFLQGDMTIIKQQATAKRLGSVVVASAAELLAKIRGQLAAHGLDLDDAGQVRAVAPAATS